MGCKIGDIIEITDFTTNKRRIDFFVTVKHVRNDCYICTLKLLDHNLEELIPSHIDGEHPFDKTQLDISTNLTNRIKRFINPIQTYHRFIR